MGAFGLVWYGSLAVAGRDPSCRGDGLLTTAPQLGQGPADRPSRGREKDHETLQYPRPREAHIPGAEAAEAPPP